MRYRLLLLTLPLLSLLTACSDAEEGPYLGLVGSSRYTSSNRTIATPGDTVTFKLYGGLRKGGQPLSHVRIFVTYAPIKNPLSYPQGYNPLQAPADPEMTYLDSALPAASREFVIQTTLNSRTTSGREQWRFEAEDTDGRKVSRGFRLQLRNIDSALTYHRYTAQLQAPNPVGNRRSFLALLSGLTLPHYTVRTDAANQALIDLVYVTTPSGICLAAPNDALTGLKWMPRTTALRATSLTTTNFAEADTNDELIARFNNATTPSTTHTEPLAKGNIYAFRTADTRSGLIYVQDIITTPIPTVLLQVRTTK